MCSFLTFACNEHACPETRIGLLMVRKIWPRVGCWSGTILRRNYASALDSKVVVVHTLPLQCSRNCPHGIIVRNCTPKGVIWSVGLWKLELSSGWVPNRGLFVNRFFFFLHTIGVESTNLKSVCGYATLGSRTCFMQQQQHPASCYPLLRQGRAHSVMSLIL